VIKHAANDDQKQPDAKDKLKKAFEVAAANAAACRLPLHSSRHEAANARAL